MAFQPLQIATTFLLLTSLLFTSTAFANQSEPSREETKRLIKEVLKDDPSLQLTDDNLVEVGERVAVLWHHKTCLYFAMSNYMLFNTFKRYDVADDFEREFIDDYKDKPVYPIIESQYELLKTGQVSNPQNFAFEAYRACLDSGSVAYDLAEEKLCFSFLDLHMFILDQKLYGNDANAVVESLVSMSGADSAVDRQNISEMVTAVYQMPSAEIAAEFFFSLNRQCIRDIKAAKTAQSTLETSGDDQQQGQLDEQPVEASGENKE